MRCSRYEKGKEILDQIDATAGEQLIESLHEISPDLEKLTIEFPFGDVYSRPGLDWKSREITAIAALTALGNAIPQLKVHVRAALNVGCTVEEIKEIIIQVTVYAGFPASLNAMQALKEVLRDINNE